MDNKKNKNLNGNSKNNDSKNDSSKNDSSKNDKSSDESNDRASDKSNDDSSYVSDEQKKYQAKWISEHPVVTQILREMEQDAIENAVNANTKDDETRRTAMNKVRAIRELKQQLNEIAGKNPKQKYTKNVA